MNETQGAAVEGLTEGGPFDDAALGRAAEQERQRTFIRRLSWALAWGVSVVALIVGISLTATGSVEQLTPLGDDTYDVAFLTVWPVGLVLIAVGALGLVASAITTAVLTTNR